MYWEYITNAKNSNTENLYSLFLGSSSDEDATREPWDEVVGDTKAGGEHIPRTVLHRVFLNKNKRQNLKTQADPGQMYSGKYQYISKVNWRRKKRSIVQSILGTDFLTDPRLTCWFSIKASSWGSHGTEKTTLTRPSLITSLESCTLTNRKNPT